MEVKTATCSSEALGRKKKKKMENSTNSRTGRLRYIYSTYFWVEYGLVRCLKRLVSPGALSLEAFSAHMIPAASIPT